LDLKDRLVDLTEETGAPAYLLAYEQTAPCPGCNGKGQITLVSIDMDKVIELIEDMTAEPTPDIITETESSCPVCCGSGWLFRMCWQ